MALPRNEFLAASVFATLAAGATSSAATAAEAGCVPVHPPSAAAFDDPVSFAFDRVAFATLLERPYAHRQIAAATTFASAQTALHFMKNSLDAYADPNGFAAGPNGLHAAAVLYGGPSPVIVLDDAMWAKYPIGEGLRKYAKPPIVGTAADPAPKTNADRAKIVTLANDRGAHFFVCNNALSGISVLFARGLDDKAPDPTRQAVVAVHADLVAHLLPGAVLVPAGVAALCAAQEARFTLIPPNA